ncbi:MAG: hypothetical protein QF473_07505 [Planctomycetota bacterium]|nr:hypothetical protein [Planctomycetota bacterium]
MDSEKRMILSSFLFPAAILLSDLSYAEPFRTAGWRGDGSGHYPGSRPPTDWSKDKNIVWSTQVDFGFSSPIAARGKVFLTAEPDKLICIDQASGKVLWEKANGADQLREKPDSEKSTRRRIVVSRHPVPAPMDATCTDFGERASLPAMTWTENGSGFDSSI